MCSLIKNLKNQIFVTAPVGQQLNPVTTADKLQ